MRKCSPYTISIISLVILMFLGCKSDSDNELIIQGVAHDSRQNIRIENATIKLSRQVLSNGTFNSSFELVEEQQSTSDGGFLFEFDRKNVVEYKIETSKSDYLSRTILINPDLVKPGEIFFEGIEMISLATVNVRLKNDSPFDVEDEIIFQNVNTNYDCDCCDNSIIVLGGMSVDTSITCSIYGDTWHRYLYTVTKDGSSETLIDSIFCNALQETSFEINY